MICSCWLTSFESFDGAIVVTVCVGCGDVGSLGSFATAVEDTAGLSIPVGFVISKRSTSWDWRSKYCLESNEIGGLNFRFYVKNNRRY